MEKEKNKKLVALYNAVIVTPKELEETTFGNIIVPDLGSTVNKLGEVVAIGEGYYSATGTFLPTQLKVGDIIVLPTMGFTRFDFNGVEHWVGIENQVLAKIQTLLN